MRDTAGSAPAPAPRPDPGAIEGRLRWLICIGRRGVKALGRDRLLWLAAAYHDDVRDLLAENRRLRGLLAARGGSWGTIE